MIDRDAVERHKRTLRLSRTTSAVGHGPVRVLLTSPDSPKGIDAVLARAVALADLRQIDGTGRGGFNTTMRHAR